MRNSNFAAFIDVFTPNTYIMVISSDSQVGQYVQIARDIATCF